MISAARDMARANGRSTQHEVSRSPEVSFRPSSPGSYGGGIGLSRVSTNYSDRPAKQLTAFATEDIKILLLENVNQTGRDALTKQGYQVEALKSSLTEDQLIAKIKDIQVIGIRSKTKLNARVLKEAKNLIAIGCFCIGTNQVDLQYAAQHGIAVFNSPFSNSRSVAELMIAEIITLARQLGDRSMEMHQGTWNKVSVGCWEVRGKTLGESDLRTPACRLTIYRYYWIWPYRIPALCACRSTWNECHLLRHPQSYGSRIS